MKSLLLAAVWLALLVLSKCQETTTEEPVDSTTLIYSTSTEEPRRVFETTTTSESVKIFTTQLLDDDENDVKDEMIDDEIANAINRANLDPKTIPDKIFSGSVGSRWLPITFETGLTKLHLYNVSSFSRNGPVKLRRTSLERNVELELDLKSDTLVLNGSAVLYLMGIGPKFEFEGTIDSVQIRVLFSYHNPGNARGSVLVKDYQLVNKRITPSLRITHPRSLTKFVTNIFFSRIVPYLGRIMIPTIESVGREIIHELVADHGFVHSIMAKYHESNYITNYDGELVEE